MTNGTRSGLVVSDTLRPPFTPGKDPVPIVQEAGWASGPVCTGAENLAPTGFRSPDRPARSQLLYRLSYPAPVYMGSVNYYKVLQVNIFLCYFVSVIMAPYTWAETCCSKTLQYIKIIVTSGYCPSVYVSPSQRKVSKHTDKNSRHKNATLNKEIRTKGENSIFIQSESTTTKLTFELNHTLIFL